MVEGMIHSLKTDQDKMESDIAYGLTRSKLTMNSSLTVEWVKLEDASNGDLQR